MLEDKDEDGMYTDCSGSDILVKSRADQGFDIQNHLRYTHSKQLLTFLCSTQKKKKKSSWVSRYLPPSGHICLITCNCG